MPRSSRNRRDIAQMGGLARSARYPDGKALTAAATAAASSRWEREVRAEFPTASERDVTRMARARQSLEMRRRANLRWHPEDEHVSGQPAEQ